MYHRADGKLLKTKIIATIGEPHDKLFDPQGNFILSWQERFGDAEGFYDNVLRWFFQPGYLNCCMIDIMRLNMSFARKEEEHGEYGKNERLIFEWLKAHRNDLAKNVAVLGDLPGPKLRLGDIGKTSI